MALESLLKALGEDTADKIIKDTINDDNNKNLTIQDRNSAIIAALQNAYLSTEDSRGLIDAAKAAPKDRDLNNLATSLLSSEGLRYDFKTLYKDGEAIKSVKDIRDRQKKLANPSFIPEKEVTVTEPFDSRIVPVEHAIYLNVENDLKSPNKSEGTIGIKDLETFKRQHPGKITGEIQAFVNHEGVKHSVTVLFTKSAADAEALKALIGQSKHAGSLINSSDGSVFRPSRSSSPGLKM